MIILSARDQHTVMGVTCRVEVDAINALQLVDDAFSQLRELEALWSRFVPTSDISRLNNANGMMTHVDHRTMSLVETMKMAMTHTHGAFNPTRLPEQIALGDSRSLTSNSVTTLPSNATAFLSMDDVCIEPNGTVQLPLGMTLDAGGIGKGFAADLVAVTLLSRGAQSVCVNVGGDIRVSSQPNHPRSWGVDVLSPIDDLILSVVSLREGAIATSARSARLRDDHGVDNHIQGAHNTVAGVSVLASTGAWAETWTKFLMATPDGLPELESYGLAGFIVFTNGSTNATSNWKNFTEC
jgi:thiamine biosynthesis lipoprotein